MTGTVMAALLLVSSSVQAAVVPAEIVVRVGDVPTGASAAVASIDPPFVEAAGVVGFGGSLDDGDDFIFRGSEVIWLNSNDEVDVLTGGEASIGTSPGGGFIYSPSFNGEDSVYGAEGLLAVENTQAADQPAGTNSTFHSRPAMTSSGQAWWVSGLNASGGTGSEGRALMRSPSATFADAVAVLQSGDTVDGLTIDSPNGVDFDFLPSHDDAHLIAVLTMDTGGTIDDGVVYVDGELVARESDTNGDGDNWDNFDIVVINNSGDYAFSGDTDGDVSSDEFIAYNGQIQLREGDAVGSMTLASNASVRFVGLSNAGVMAHAWGDPSSGEVVLFSCQPGALATSSSVLLTVGDELDLDGDGVGDGLFVTDLNASATSPTRPLGDDGSLYLEVEVDEGGVLSDAMIRLEAACCGNGIVDPGEDCDDGNDDNGDACLDTCVPSTCGDGILDPDTEECDDGNDDETDACTSLCEDASCGDGLVQAGVEACDDGNDVDTDACLSTCENAACGDGVVHEGVELCDDGNDDDGDACLSTCAVASCGDGEVQVDVEACDDGNADQTDDCLETCVLASCGDGFVQAKVEACDDGDADNDDGCLDTCVEASCGDGFVDARNEDCDDGNDDDADGCLSSCVAAACGDGVVQDGVEACDDGNDIDDDACSNACELGEGPSGGSTGSAETGSTGDGETGETGEPVGMTTGDEAGTSAGEDSTGAASGGGAADDGGCGCSTPDGEQRQGTLMGFLLSVGCLLRRRRRSA